MTTEAEDLVREAGDVTILMVQHALVECLARQAREESRETGRHVHPGEILDKALRMYLEVHGKPDAVDYLHKIAGTPQ